MDTKYKADASIADSSREFKMQKAHFDSEVNTKVTPIIPLHFIMSSSSSTGQTSELKSHYFMPCHCPPPLPTPKKWCFLDTE